VTDGIIEDESICKVSSWSVAVAERSIEIEITQEYPIHRIINVMTTKPINKF